MSLVISLSLPSLLLLPLPSYYCCCPSIQLSLLMPFAAPSAPSSPCIPGRQGRLRLLCRLATTFPAGGALACLAPLQAPQLSWLINPGHRHSHYPPSLPPSSSASLLPYTTHPQPFCFPFLKSSSSSYKLKLSFLPPLLSSSFFTPIPPLFLFLPPLPVPLSSPAICSSPASPPPPQLVLSSSSSSCHEQFPRPP